MFESIQAAPADPILGLTDAFRRDERPDKMNLGVGVYQDEAGRVPILQCVKQAEQQVYNREDSKGYLPIGGIAEYGAQLRQLMLGDLAPSSERCATFHTPGGTGALRVAADFLHQVFPETTIWLSQPTWANHPAIFRSAGVPTQEYRYLRPDGKGIDFGGMCEDLQGARQGDVVLLHGCCHNPSGADLSPEQWVAVGQLCQHHGLTPLVDLAYQGFGSGLDADAAGLRALVEQQLELLLASSCSKNFSLYRERVGGLTIVTRPETTAAAAESRLKVAVRTNYSNPPSHGAAVVCQILADTTLRNLWHSELESMRQRIHDMRSQFADAMRDQTGSDRFDFVRDQRGMFSFSGLTPEQVDRLRDEHAIYMVRSGRMNVAGMTSASMSRLAKCVAAVL